MNLNIYKKEELELHSYLFESTELCEIMGRNKSDKGNRDLTRTHNYTTIYSKLFQSLRDKPINIFELGLGTNNINLPSNMGINGRPGASLYGWSEFFPKAKIYGADIDKDILFNEDRIKTFYCNQLDPGVICDMWGEKELKDKQFDIIIEDGLHVLDAQICFFENSIHKVRDGGYYIIEDFNHGLPFQKMCETFKKFKSNNKYTDLDVSIYQLPATSPVQQKNGNNALVIIKR